MAKHLNMMTEKNTSVKEFVSHSNIMRKKEELTTTWENLLKSTIRVKQGFSFAAISLLNSKSKSSMYHRQKITMTKNKTSQQNAYISVRSTNVSNVGFASLVSYSNHSEGSTTKLSLHINYSIIPTPSCPINIYKCQKIFKPHPST